MLVYLHVFTVYIYIYTHLDLNNIYIYVYYTETCFLKQKQSKGLGSRVAGSAIKQCFNEMNANQFT